MSVSRRGLRRSPGSRGSGTKLPTLGTSKPVVYTWPERGRRISKHPDRYCG